MSEIQLFRDLVNTGAVYVIIVVLILLIIYKYGDTIINIFRSRDDNDSFRQQHFQFLRNQVLEIINEINKINIQIQDLKTHFIYDNSQLQRQSQQILHLIDMLNREISILKDLIIKYLEDEK